MSTRNLIWLAVIVVVGVVVWIIVGAVWGLVAAGVALVASEAVQRVQRRQRASETGADIPKLRNVLTRDRKR